MGNPASKNVMSEDLNSTKQKQKLTSAINSIINYWQNKTQTYNDEHIPDLAEKSHQGNKYQKHYYYINSVKTLDAFLIKKKLIKKMTIIMLITSAEEKFELKIFLLPKLQEWQKMTTNFPNLA